jgi:hypothetical protein
LVISAPPSSRSTFAVRTHVVVVECLEKHRWRVSVDGHLLASFCSQSRARAAGRTEARRLDFVASDLRWKSGAPLSRRT